MASAREGNPVSGGEKSKSNGSIVTPLGNSNGSKKTPPAPVVPSPADTEDKGEFDEMPLPQSHDHAAQLQAQFDAKKSESTESTEQLDPEKESESTESAEQPDPEDDSFPNPFTSPIQCPQKLFSTIDEYFLNNIINVYLPENKTESRGHLRFVAQKFGQFLGLVAGSASIFVSAIFAPLIFFGALPIKNPQKAFAFALSASLLLGTLFIAAPYILPAVLAWVSKLSFLGIGSFFSNVIVPTWGPQLSLLTGTTFGVATFGSAEISYGAALMGAGLFPYIMPLIVSFFALKCLFVPFANEVLLPYAKQAYAYIRALCGCKDDSAKKDPEKQPVAQQQTLRQASSKQAGKVSFKQQRAIHIADHSLPIDLSKNNGTFEWQNKQSGHLFYCINVEGQIRKYTGSIQTINDQEYFVTDLNRNAIPISFDNGYGANLGSNTGNPSKLSDIHSSGPHRSLTPPPRLRSTTLDASSTSTTKDKEKKSSSAAPQNPLLTPHQKDPALDAALKQAASAQAKQKTDAKDERKLSAMGGSTVTVHTGLGSTPAAIPTPVPAAPKKEEPKQSAPSTMKVEPQQTESHQHQHKRRGRGGRRS